MSSKTSSPADNVDVGERLQPIGVSARYVGGYRSEVSICDLAVSYLNELKAQAACLCPVRRLLDGAGVAFDVVWIREQ